MPTTKADPAPQGPSLEEAAVRMEALLDFREGEANQEATDTADKEAPDTEGGEGVAAEAEPKETTEDKSDAGEAEATATDDDAEATADKNQLITVTVDGKTEQITLEEAAKGYQRWGDYTRKTAELANERRELGKHADAVKEERQTYATMLGALRDQLQALQPQEPNWEEVYRNDPVGYARQRDEWRDKQDKIAAANFEMQRLQSLQQKQNAENLAKIVADGRARMLDLNPAWRDQKVWEADRGAIVEYARKVGYTPEEIAQAYDPRAIVFMNKARLYDELMAKKPQPVVARGPRVATAGAAPASANITRLNAAQQRLAKSGRIDDAAKVFEQII
jgi:hypothetical protein